MMNLIHPKIQAYIKSYIEDWLKKLKQRNAPTLRDMHFGRHGFQNVAREMGQNVPQGMFH